MNIKKIISIGLCALTLSTSASLPAFAAISADPNNSQIVNKVEQFNNTALAALRKYIFETNYQFVKEGKEKAKIVHDLIVLYQRLDRLVVSNINVANELWPSPGSYNLGSISTNLGMLISSLYNVSLNGIHQCYDFPIFFIKTQIISLNYSLDQIEASNNKNKDKK